MSLWSNRNPTTDVLIDGVWQRQTDALRILTEWPRERIIQAAYDQGRHLAELAIRFGDTAEAFAFEYALMQRVRGWERYAEQMIARLAFWQGARGLPLDIDESEVRTHFQAEFGGEDTLAAIAAEMQLSYDTLAKAAREGRIAARRSGATWLTTQDAVRAALDAGTIRPYTAAVAPSLAGAGRGDGEYHD